MGFVRSPAARIFGADGSQAACDALVRAERITKTLGGRQPDAPAAAPEHVVIHFAGDKPFSFNTPDAAAILDLLEGA